MVQGWYRDGTGMIQAYHLIYVHVADQLGHHITDDVMIHR